MENTTLERDLQNFDYSSIHPVKEKILGQLLELQRQRNSKNLGNNILQQKMSKKISFDTLSYAAAAGNAASKRKSSEVEDEDDN